MSSFGPKLTTSAPIPVDQPVNDGTPVILRRNAPSETPVFPQAPGAVGDRYELGAGKAGGRACLLPRPISEPRTAGASFTQAPSAADPGRIDDAVSRLRALLDESGVFGDVSHDELREVNGVLRRLNATETRAVYGRLTDAERAVWGREVNSGAPLGAGGLDASEKRELIDMLAARLSGAQLGDFSRRLGEHEDVIAVGNAVARLGSTGVKLELVREFAAAAETGDRARLETHFGLSKTISEDPQAVAIAEVLASLHGNSVALGSAVGALSPSQLEAVITSAARGSVTTTVLGETAGTTVDYEPALLVRLLDAGATSRDPAVKERLFRAAARQLGAIQETGNLVMTYADRRDDGRQVADAMTRLLRSDTSGIMRQLETQGDRDGASLVPYATEMVKQGRRQALGEIILDLQLGNDHKGNAIDRFEATTAGTTGRPYYMNAEVLGYFVGALQVGIAANASSSKEQAALLKSVFGTVAGLVPVPEIAKTVANGLVGAVVDEVCRSVAAGAKDLRSALRELAYPRDAAGRLYEGPAEESYDSTVGRVIDEQAN